MCVCVCVCVWCVCVHVYLHSHHITSSGTSFAESDSAESDSAESDSGGSAITRITSHRYMGILLLAVGKLGKHWHSTNCLR